MIRLELFQAVQQGLKVVPQESMTDNNIRVVPLNCSQQAVEQCTLCFDRLKGAAFCPGSLFKSRWKLFDRTDDGV